MPSGPKQSLPQLRCHQRKQSTKQMDSQSHQAPLPQRQQPQRQRWTSKQQLTHLSEPSQGGYPATGNLHPKSLTISLCKWAKVACRPCVSVPPAAGVATCLLGVDPVLFHAH